MSNLKEFETKFRTQEFKIYETDYWVWSLRPHQVTVGAGILSLKRECLTFGELYQEEYSDLNNIIKVIETTLKSIFNFDVMNYLMLMIVDKHVHYHIVPRYKGKVEMFGTNWEDSSWPAVPNLLGEPLEEKKLEEIKLLIQSKIKKIWRI